MPIVSTLLVFALILVVFLLSPRALRLEAITVWNLDNIRGKMVPVKLHSLLKHLAKLVCNHKLREEAQNLTVITTLWNCVLSLCWNVSQRSTAQDTHRNVYAILRTMKNSQLHKKKLSSMTVYYTHKFEQNGQQLMAK